MIRVPTPTDLNPTTRRFKRTLMEAFPCDAAQARAMFKAFDVCEYSALWWTGLSVLAIVAGVVIAVTA